MSLSLGLHEERVWWKFEKPKSTQQLLPKVEKEANTTENMYELCNPDHATNVA